MAESVYENPVILVLEDDQPVREFLMETVSSVLPEAEVVGFEDGLEAWKNAKDRHYDLVIQDWKVPSLHGLAFFCRLRKQPPHATTPIIAVSGHLKPKDFRLLEEFPFTWFMEKPVKAVSLQTKIKQALAEAEWFQSMEDTIEPTVTQAGTSEGKWQEVVKILASTHRPVAIGLYLARKLAANGQFDKAKQLLLEALQREPDSSLLMTELGKTLLHLKNTKEALTWLEKAQLQSPKNVNRLCLLGDASLEAMEPEKAKEWFEKAMELDDSDETAAEGHQLSETVLDFVSSHQESQIPASFASLLNAIGVARARKGKFTESIEHYRSAIKHLYDELAKGRVCFNVGLALFKKAEYRESLEWFEQAEQLAALRKATRFVEFLKSKLGESLDLGPEIESTTEEVLQPVPDSDMMNREAPNLGFEDEFGIADLDEEFGDSKVS